jgi:hypothetical protein
MCGDLVFFPTVINDILAGVAQLVEQLICNQPVAGSSPIASSNANEKLYPSPCFWLTANPLCGEVPERSKGPDCKSGGDAFGGSNPPLSTIMKSDFEVL